MGTTHASDQKYPHKSRAAAPPAPLTRAPVDPSYDYTRATADNYRAAARINDDIWSISHNSNGGPFKHIRDARDHAFHGVYAPARQRLQDKIVEHYVNFRSGWNLPGPESSIRNTASIVEHFLRKHTPPAPHRRRRHRQHHPVIVFTAGAMGAGKSHTVRWLARTHGFPLEEFVVCDPDRIREHFPEMEGYRTRWAPTCGSLTQKEAGYIAELVWCAALEQGKSVIIDSSLRDVAWWESVIAGVRREGGGGGSSRSSSSGSSPSCGDGGGGGGGGPYYRMCILHVVAAPQVVFERVQRRAEQTGRMVPLDMVRETLTTVPQSVAALAPLVDVWATIDATGREPRLVKWSSDGRVTTVDAAAAVAFATGGAATAADNDNGGGGGSGGDRGGDRGDGPTPSTKSDAGAVWAPLIFAITKPPAKM